MSPKKLDRPKEESVVNKGTKSVQMKAFDASQPDLDDNCKFIPEINKKSANLNSRNYQSNKVSRTEQLYLMDKRKREEKEKKA